MKHVVEIKDSHIAGHYAANFQEWDNVFDDVEDDDVTMTGMTECRLDVVPSQWSQYIPSRQVNLAECSLGWDRRVWAGFHADYVWLSRISFHRGNGGKREGVIGSRGVFDHKKTGLRVGRLVAHLPSSVQDGKKFSKKDDRVRSWKEARKNIGKEWRKLAREFECAVIIVSIDGNVDLSKLPWREQFLTRWAFRGMRLVVGSKGTHGNRTIDGHFIILRKGRMKRRVRAQVGAKRKAFDHKRTTMTAVVSFETRAA